jgi:DNA-binding MarR family transcriptional regulator
MAPTLSHAELRILLCMALDTAADEHASGETSSRELHRQTKVARSNIQPAMDSLAKKGLITTRKGNGPKATRVHLSFTETIKFTGPVSGPVRPENREPTSGSAGT